MRHSLPDPASSRRSSIIRVLGEQRCSRRRRHRRSLLPSLHPLRLHSSRDRVLGQVYQSATESATQNATADEFQNLRSFPVIIDYLYLDTVRVQD